MNRVEKAQSFLHDSIIQSDGKSKASIRMQLDYNIIQYAKANNLFNEDGGINKPGLNIFKWIAIAKFFLDMISQLISIWNGENTYIGLYKGSEK